MLRPSLHIPRIRVPQWSGRVPAAAVAATAPWRQVQFRRRMSDYRQQPPPSSSSFADNAHRRAAFNQAEYPPSASDQGEQEQQQKPFFDDAEEQPNFDEVDEQQQQQPGQIYNVQRLLHHQPFYCKPMRIPSAEFLSGDAFELAWAEYQMYLIEKLNQLVQPFPSLHTQDIKNVVLETARNPNTAAIFNYASMAHNNEFFFKSLAQEPTDAEKMPRRLMECVRASFGSVETLREEMQAIALAMFGPGFVWLVKVTDTPLGMPDARLRVLPTYLAGSPYPKAHWRRQKEAMPAAVGLGAGGEEGAPRQFMDSNAYGTGRASQPPSMEEFPPGGMGLEPILCLNTWEFVWLMQYGVGGKERYVEQWWKYIDWNRVYQVSGLEQTRRVIAG